MGRSACSSGVPPWPPLPGATGVQFRRFLVANVLGAAGFVPYGVGLGYAIGYGLEGYVAEIRYAERLVLGGMIILFMALVGWRMVRTIRRRGSLGRGPSS